MEISKDIIKYPQPKAFETKDHIYINNVAHDKKSLSQIPHNTIVTIDDRGPYTANLYNLSYIKFPMIHFKESTYSLGITLSGQSGNVWMPSMSYINQKKVIRDINDENIHYIILGGYYTRLIKLDTRTNEYDIMHDLTYYGYEIIHQTDEHLYFTYYHGGYISSTVDYITTHQMGIIRIDKKSYKTTVIENLLQSSSTSSCMSLVVHKDDKKIIFEQLYYATNNNSSTVFYKCLDLRTFSIVATRTSAYVTIMSGTCFHTIAFNSIKLNEESVATYYPIRHKDGSFKFIKSTTNITDEYITNSDSIEAHAIDVDFGSENSTITTDLLDALIKNEKVSFITKAKNGKRYIIVFLRKTQSTFIPRRQSGIYVFELVTDEQIVYKNRLLLDGAERNVHRVDDNYNNIYVISDNCTYNLKFNQDAENYEVIKSIGLVSAALSTDELNRVWLLDIKGSLHLFDEAVGDKINISFADDNLTYTGVDFDTNILVNCTNVSEKKISENIELKISGNARFKESSSDTISLSTLDGADVAVAITINGPGQIYIYPKIIM